MTPDRRGVAATAMVPVALGLVSGLLAAVAWHVAVPVGVPASIGPVAAEYAPQRPSWWPSLILLPAAGALLGALIGAVVVVKGWRLAPTRSAPSAPLVALLVGSALLIGGGCAVAWSVWPPEDTYAVAREFQRIDHEVSAAGSWEEYCRREGILCATVTVASDADGTAASYVGPGTLSEPPIRVPLGNPWLTFPLLALVGASALGLVCRVTGRRLVRGPTTGT